MTAALQTTPSSGPKEIELKFLSIDELVMGNDYRLDDDPEELTALAADIKTRGILNPLRVRRKEAGWEIVAGRRRLFAARRAGLERVPCIIAQVASDEEAEDDALAENLHRRNLSPVEEGLAYARLRDRGLSQAEIAKKVGRSQPHVSSLLMVLKLPAAIRDQVHRRELSYATALRPHRQTGTRQGSSKPAPALSGEDVSVVSHWRRRHDRLVAGLHALRKA